VLDKVMLLGDKGNTTGLHSRALHANLNCAHACARLLCTSLSACASLRLQFSLPHTECMHMCVCVSVQWGSHTLRVPL
jgi:hypothetical protein